MAKHGLLPPRYFQNRPTGVISARLHGVETIREFIASAAVTLILDCPFLLICVDGVIQIGASHGSERLSVVSGGKELYDNAPQIIEGWRYGRSYGICGAPHDDL